MPSLHISVSTVSGTTLVPSFGKTPRPTRPRPRLPYAPRMADAEAEFAQARQRSSTPEREGHATATTASTRGSVARTLPEELPMNRRPPRLLGANATAVRGSDRLRCLPGGG